MVSILDFAWVLVGWVVSVGVVAVTGFLVGLCLAWGWSVYGFGVW